MSEKKPSDYAAQLDSTRKIWDAEAATFDNEADHGLRQSNVREAWKTVLLQTVSVSEKQATALDIGCGTGSLSMLLAELGYSVTGIDLSPEMIALAQEKVNLAKQRIDFHVMDAAFPELATQFDVVVCRHVLWTLPEPEKVLERWIKLLQPKARLYLIEGFWFTGAGLHAKDIIKMMPARMTDIEVKNLSEQADLWGKSVTDERYLISAKLGL